MIDTSLATRRAAREMRREARANGVTCAEIWLREAFKHPSGTVTISGYHEDGTVTKRRP